MIKTKVSSKISGQLNFLIISAIFIIIIILTMDSTRDIFGVMLASVIFLVHLYNFLKVRAVSYDSEYVYLKSLSKESQLNYTDIVKIKRVLGRFYEASNFNFGYTLVYLDENGKRRTCHFYIPLQNTLLWNKLKEKIIENNPTVEFAV
jgi:hypothetical protein